MTETTKKRISCLPPRYKKKMPINRMHVAILIKQMSEEYPKGCGRRTLLTHAVEIILSTLNG